MVEDDADVMALFGEALAGASWQVLPCRTDGDALVRLEEEQPDAVLLDVRLDGRCTGWELLQSISTNSALRHLPVIVCTGSTVLSEEQLSWLGNHHIPLLRKPFDLDELEVVVNGCLSVGSASVV